MRRIVITDYPGVLYRDLEYEKNRILAALQDTEVEVVPFENREQWIHAVGNADALLTAFLPINDAVMEAVPNLRCIVLNASGYDNVDLAAATRRHIAVIPIEEYCTDEVAEHTMALILALSRGLKPDSSIIPGTQRPYRIYACLLRQIRCKYGSTSCAGQ